MTSVGSEKTPSKTAPGADVAIEGVLGVQERTIFQRLHAGQTFWIFLVLLAICAVMSYLEPSFRSVENFYNITRNFAFIGIMAIGATAVIITGGIDLSVGSIMGVVAVASGLTLEGGYSWILAMLAGLGVGLICGAINGVLIAYGGLSSFVVTLGMMSIARSAAVVLSNNRMIYNFGPEGVYFKAFGNGKIDLTLPDGEILSLSFPFLTLIIMTVVFAVVLAMSAWGRHLLAIGGNEQAAILTGVPVKRVKLQAYILSALCAAIAAILNVGWSGSAINALGQGYELRAITSAVIGGANLLGGEGSAIGAAIGSALLEVIRNALLMAGIDSNWQGMFVGALLILAVLLQRIRAQRRG